MIKNEILEKLKCTCGHTISRLSWRVGYTDDYQALDHGCSLGGCGKFYSEKEIIRINANQNPA